ncbi:MAG: O-acetylhomoserine aminocarboxypropyltransferase/cysteine synthase family protein [Opitutales bacterium]
MKNYKLETQAVQAGYEPKNGEARITPICQSTTFKYEKAQDLADLFDLKASGHFYTRLSNPTTEALQAKFAALEGGIGAVAYATGQAAVSALAINLCEAGDHVLSSSTVYGGVYNLFNSSLKRLGIDSTFIDQDLSEEELIKAVKPNTKFIFAETISNPNMKVLDIEKFARVAKAVDLPLVIDNTFATPALCKPLDFGANIVVHSLSKYADGHASSMGGIIIDKGDYNFDNGKFKGLSTPDESYHGLTYTKAFGKMGFIVKCITHILRDFGGTISPFNSFVINMNLSTLALRMKKHSDNALEVAKYLENHPKVAWVKYPNLESSSELEKSKKYLKGASGVLTFGVKGGKESAVKFMDALNLVAQVIHVADVRSSVLHPASTTHRQLSDAELIATGISPELIRVSVGIEDAEDIIADFEQALQQA